MTTAVVETAPVAEPTATPINPAQAATPAPVVETPAPTEEAPVVPTVIDEGIEADVVDPDAPTSADADADGVITYEPTGDAGMDMALTFAGKLGLGMDHPAMAATVTGDWSLLEAHLATLGDKAAGWQQMIALAKEADGRLTAKQTEATTAINNAVSGVLGESEAAVLAWAGKAATADEKSEINTMLRASPVQARAAAMLLASLYAQASGTVVVPANAMREGGGSNPAQGDTSPISRKQFANETNKLHSVHGANYVNTPEYRALSARLR